MKLKELIMNMSSYNMDAEVYILTSDGKKGKVDIEPIGNRNDDNARKLTVRITERPLTEAEIIEKEELENTENT